MKVTYKIYDPAGSDEEYPALCTDCKAPAIRLTSLKRPSDYGFMVACDNNHITVGMPAEGCPEESQTI